MEWSNPSALEFIELLEREPILWDPKHKNRKDRNLVSTAWTRIQDGLAVPSTLQELKKKKNTLFTQYRECLKKIKMRAESEPDEIYQPSWFAFDAIHSFMGGTYVSSLNSQKTNFNYETYLAHEASTQDVSESQSDESTHRLLSRESNSSNNEYISTTSSRARKRRRGVQYLNVKQDDEAFSSINKDGSYLLNVVKDDHKEHDECDIYGQLLAQKLKKMEEDDRLKLMNDIDNLTYKSIVAANKRNRLSLVE